MNSETGLLSTNCLSIPALFNAKNTRPPIAHPFPGAEGFPCLSHAFLFFSSPSFLPLSPARAELTRFEILKREPFADGIEFGKTGAYQRIIGRLHFELDPEAEANLNVVDLRLAPRNKRGLVEFSSDLFLIAPADLKKGNGALLYDVNNRGNKNALRNFNRAPGSNDPHSILHAGDGFLFRHGWTVVWSGWDGELLPGNNRLRLAAPPVGDGKKPITGLIRCEIVPGSDQTKTVVNWANHGSYRPTDHGLKTATLTHRVLPGHPRVPIPRKKWKLIVTEVAPKYPSQLPRVELEYPDTLKKGHIYELIYEARDPLVMGTGFAAVRDLISALRHGGGKGNPLVLGKGKSAVERTYGFGVSQSGRFLREFLHSGFNADERGRKVFDGLIPHVSGSGMGSFNHRFAQPTRHAGQHDHHDYPPDRFPFAYETQSDPLSGQTDGILLSSLKNGTAPLVFHTQSSSEYWHRSGSLVHDRFAGSARFKDPEQCPSLFLRRNSTRPKRFSSHGGRRTKPEEPG